MMLGAGGTVIAAHSAQLALTGALNVSVYFPLKFMTDRNLSWLLESTNT